METASRATIDELPWDSKLFGIRVGELDLDRKGALDAIEEDARDFDLVYVRSEEERELSDEICTRFHGARVDSRVTFARPLEGAPRSESRHVRSIAEGDPASARAIEIAKQASTHSRFRTDPRFPSDWTDKLYRVWMENSLARARAEEVLGYFDGEELQGIYTVRVENSIATLELFAVDQPARGRGIGRVLLEAGLAWADAHGVAHASVTTQRQNPASVLYRACGYAPVQYEAIYHLWPRGNPAA